MSRYGLESSNENARARSERLVCLQNSFGEKGAERRIVPISYHISKTESGSTIGTAGKWGSVEIEVESFESILSSRGTL
jgi:hypothetical protein